MKLYSVIQSEQDASELQSSLDILCIAWSNQWQLSIWSKKSTVLCLGQTHIDQSDVIKWNNVGLLSKICDLGILVDDKLTMSQHICALVKKAQARASLSSRFHSRHRATLLEAFITYVRPLLECATPVWSPYTLTDISKIESVKRSFTKRLYQV